MGELYVLNQRSSACRYNPDQNLTDGEQNYNYLFNKYSILAIFFLRPYFQIPDNLFADNGSCFANNKTVFLTYENK